MRSVEFKYMQSLHDTANVPSEEYYDYIVIGGSTAGRPLAVTLSESYSVLVLKRGSAPIAHPNVLTLNGVSSFLMREHDGTTPAQRFTSEVGVANLRCRDLSVTSMIKRLLY